MRRLPIFDVLEGVGGRGTEGQGRSGSAAAVDKTTQVARGWWWGQYARVPRGASKSRYDATNCYGQALVSLERCIQAPQQQQQTILVPRLARWR